MSCLSVIDISHQTILRHKNLRGRPQQQLIPQHCDRVQHSYGTNRNRLHQSHRVKLMASAVIQQSKTLVRRSGNYHPSIWDHDFIQSLGNEYAGKPYLERRDSLKRNVKDMLEKSDQAMKNLEMIDDLQRLGLAYHFEEQIKKYLIRTYNEIHEDKMQKNDDLCVVALKFKLLRQHGYKVLPDIFNGFKDSKGNFKECLCKDVKGVLYLYEASFYLTQGENILEEAQDFTAKILHTYVSQCREGYISLLASHSLEIPTHWRMRREEARWFIDAYEYNPYKNPVILELAKLDFNIVQAIHQDDLKHLSWWWKKGCFAEKLPFARDRLVENFIWSVGMNFEPQFEDFRRMLTKLGASLTLLDDVYDVYGTVDELEQLTDTIFRWDVNAMDKLPECMKIMFLSIYNFSNEIALIILRDRGVHILPYLKKAWADLSKSYLLEAKWYKNRYTPTLQEYLNNGWISITGPVMLFHTLFFVTNPIEDGMLETLECYPSIIQLSSMMVRLADDLGTASHEIERGDNAKSIQCYMHENGISEEDGRKHINYLISETWKKINHETFSNTVFNETFMGMARDLARQAQAMYLYGDGHGVQASSKTKNRIISLFIQPISVSKQEELLSVSD